MVPELRPNPNLEAYDMEGLTIGTICSHSALQIFHGAKQEGFATIGITKEDRREMYASFPMGRPDEFMVVDDFSEMLKPSFQRELMERNVVLIPPGSSTGNRTGPRSGSGSPRRAARCPACSESPRTSMSRAS
jgi:5-formaminoimidazole-4-carboxamide-1-(beta)-D-ribofuranosyl 5'-monophosphate synthetase